MTQPEHDEIRLTIPDPLAQQMDRCLITPDDVRRTIRYCEKTGVKLLDNATGELVGHLRDGALTYWVRYRPVSDGAYTLTAVYSHRAALQEETLDA